MLSWCGIVLSACWSSLLGEYVAGAGMPATSSTRGADREHVEWKRNGSALHSILASFPPNWGTPKFWSQDGPGNSGRFRVRRISPKFSCIKFFQIRDVPTQIPGNPGHSLSKTTEKGHLHKVFVWDIPTFGSLMSQEYPAQKLYV